MPPKKREIPPHLRERYLKEKAEFDKKKAAYLAAQAEKAKKEEVLKQSKDIQKMRRRDQQSGGAGNIDVLPQPMRGLGTKEFEPSMDFLVRLSDVNNSAYLVSLQQEKIMQATHDYLRNKNNNNNKNANTENKASDGDASNQSNQQQEQQQQEEALKYRRKLLSQLPDVSRLLLEIDMNYDRAWGLPSVSRGIIFIVGVFFIFLYTIIVPWSIVNSRNSELSLWAKQSAASWTRSWLPDSLSSNNDGRGDTETGIGDATQPFLSSSFVVSGNDGIYNVFKNLFDQSNALPASWIPVGSLVFSIGLGDPASVVCPTSIAPFPVASTSSSSASTTPARKVTCMPFDISLTSGFMTSSSYKLTGLVPQDPTKKRIIIAPTYDQVPNAPSIGAESDLLCLGAVCAPESFRQVGWSFPSVNRYPHNSATVLRWRLAATMNSTSWLSDSQFSSSNYFGSTQREMYYPAETDVVPTKISTTSECYDALSTLIKIPGPYLALSLAEFTVYDVSSDSLLSFSLGFETQGGAGAFTGKFLVSSFSMGDDGRNIALRTFSIIFSVFLLAYAIFVPIIKIFVVRDVANCSGCHFDETMKRRPFKTITWAKCVSCKEPTLVKGTESFRCEKCNALQPCAEHHRCWRSCLFEPSWILNFWCGVLGLFWGGADGVTLGHVTNYLSLMQSQVTQFGCSFLTFRNLAMLMQLHQQGLGAIVLLLAAVNAQRVFWHIAGGQIALAWLKIWRRATAIFTALISCVVVVAVLCSWTIGLPAYRNGVAEGSVTESFSPPGITLGWAQFVIWWLGRFVILAIAALGIAVVIAGGTAHAKVDTTAQMTYDPDWESAKLCVVKLIEKYWKKPDQPQTDTGENNQQNRNQNNATDDIEMKTPSAKQNRNDNDVVQKSASPKHPVDPVLEQQAKEQELSADPLTFNVDKLERCVTNLMSQLPPILEDAVDERVHFSLMEQSRMLVLEETEKERSQAIHTALEKVGEMRQQEWDRQAKMLAETEDYYYHGNDGDEEDEEAYYYDYEESDNNKIRSNNDDDDEQIENLDDYLSGNNDKQRNKSAGVVQLRPQSSISKNSFDSGNNNTNENQASENSSPRKYGRGNNHPGPMKVSELMSLASEPSLNNKSRKSPRQQKPPVSMRKLNKKLPNLNNKAQHYYHPSFQNDFPSFSEYADLHEAAQVSLRNDVISHIGVPAEMEYIPNELAYDRNQNNNNNNNNMNSLSSNLPISYSPNNSRYQKPLFSYPNNNNNVDDDDDDDDGHSPNVIPKKYRSQDPQDYIVQHLLDEDEIQDVLNRESSNHRNNDYNYRDRPSSSYSQSPRNNNNYNNNNSRRQNKELGAHELPFGRYSGLPHSRILNEPKELVGRPFGGAPEPLNLPQPPVKRTDMAPKHY